MNTGTLTDTSDIVEGFVMYNPIKAAQIIAYFAMQCETKSISILKAIKLVYLSDRTSIEKWGFPILDEVRVSMPHGPVNSFTYSHISGEHDLEKCGWSKFLTDKADHEVSVADLISFDDLDALSEADIECLEQVWSEFGEMGRFELRDWTHNPNNIPEWEDPGSGSKSIPLKRIMISLGMKNIDNQIETICDHENIDRLFDSISAIPEYTM